MQLSKSLKLNFRKLIGNDIVDLKVAEQESNWKRKGYLHKIFTQEEQLLILSNPDPQVMVWLLWSMKEAAYKIHSCKNGTRSFAPTQLCCEVFNLSLNHSTGLVRMEETVFFTESTLNDQLIHTICASGKDELRQIEVNISKPKDPLNFNYHPLNPQCVSHHGAYLALVFLNQGSLR